MERNTLLYVLLFFVFLLICSSIPLNIYKRTHLFNSLIKNNYNVSTNLTQPINVILSTSADPNYLRADPNYLRADPNYLRADQIILLRRRRQDPEEPPADGEENGEETSASESEATSETVATTVGASSSENAVTTAVKTETSIISATPIITAYSTTAPNTRPSNAITQVTLTSTKSTEEKVTTGDIEEPTETTKHSEDKETTSAEVKTETTQKSTTTLPTSIPEPDVVPGQICTTSLFKQVDSCCRTPTLIDEDDVDRCMPSTGRRRKRQLWRQITEFLFPRIIPRRTVQIPKKVATPTLDNGFIFTDDTNANVGQVLSDDDTLNMNMTLSALKEIAPAWRHLLESARTKCEPLLRATDADALMRHPSGQMCLELPTKMLRCIKRTLALQCPSPISQGVKCYMIMDELKSCDIFAL